MHAMVGDRLHLHGRVVGASRASPSSGDFSPCVRTGDAREPAKSSLPAAWMTAPAYHLLPRESRRGGGAIDAAHSPRPIARVPSAC